MKRKILSLLLSLMLVLVAVVFWPAEPASAAGEKAPFITTASTTADEVLKAIDTASYIKLGADLELTLSGQTLPVDLAGYNLTVKGTGTVCGFDTANDTYDHLACGVLTVGEDVVCESAFNAPNGVCYVALSEGNYTTFHRLDIKIKTVTLRAASAGLYYKTTYQCDRQLEAEVISYGVVVSLQDVPGADFKSADEDVYTVSSAKFVSGTTITSGSVVDILKEELPASENQKRSRMPIYANAYVDFGNGPVMADTVNDGTKNGTSASLWQVIKALDAVYPAQTQTVQSQLDAFDLKWKTVGVDFGTENIGKEKKHVDNSNLVFDTGTTNALCPVCEKKVTWTAISKPVTAKDGGHYYLAEDVAFADDGTTFVKAPTTGQTACFHLNGHNVTNTEGCIISSGNGVLNVMGNGVVTGYNGKSTQGAAVRVNNKSAGTAINLYGGIYKKTEQAKSSWPVIRVADAGGRLHVYPGVTIGNGTGTALETAENHYRDCYVSLNGCTIDGSVDLNEPLDEYPNKTNLEMIDCTINGTLKVTPRHSVTLSGKMVVQKLTVTEDGLITTKGLAESSSVVVNATGVFSTASGSLDAYLAYFKPSSIVNRITVKDGALHCGRDFVSDLSFAEGTTKALCPACKKTVTWTELTGGTEVFVPEANSHYYLAGDVAYTGDDSAFIKSTSDTQMTCIHLNGHNLTAEKSRVVFASSSIVNFMGSGVVKGRFNSSGNNGSTIHTNNKTAVINLYSGTYAQGSGVDDAQYTVNAQGAGGTINVYEDALIKGNVNGNALRVGNASAANLAVNVYGATIEGNVLVVGAKADTYTASLLLDGAKVSGTVDINGKNNVTFIHNTVIDLLDMEGSTKVTLDRLTSGADITVKNAGTFTNANAKTAEYLKYFTPENLNDAIVVRDDMLTQKYNYTAKVLPDENGKAFCPACRDEVTWTAFSDDTQAVTFTSGGHYYLTRDMNYTGDSTYMTTGAKETATCLHLNGYNITSAESYVFFISYGYLNVMGDGVVKGHSATANRGEVLYANNKTETNGVTLYSGTYTKCDLKNSNAIIAMGGNGGNITICEDALIDAGTGLAINTGTALNRSAVLRINNATIKGNITVPEAASETFNSVVETQNTTITGTMKVSGKAEITFSGRTKIGKLVLADGAVTDFKDMLSGSKIIVSADGVFTPKLDDPLNWVGYFATKDAGDWVIVRGDNLYQGIKNGLPAAEQKDVEALLAAYGDRVVRYGEMHNHSTDGPEADGHNTIAEWKAEMERLGIDFATIVDHRQSLHMYEEAWDESAFIGGSETGSAMSDLGVEKNHCHYNMIFSDVKAFEELIKTFVQFEEHSPYGEGYVFDSTYIKYTQVQELAARIRELGGFFVHVHPKFPSYIQSDDPLDYYFGDYMGLEIMITSSGNLDCNTPGNIAAYQLWYELLAMGKKVYATYGNDNHRLPNINSLATMYTSEKDANEYIWRMREGDFNPGWVGIRMQIGDATMGGTTNFDGQRLVISAGDMFEAKYDATHEYTIRLYDENGLLMENELDPGQMNYFALDADPNVMFYRVEVYDYTINQYVAVGNPIWNG